MKKRLIYQYAILRYVHDIGTGEFINVGVAIFFPEINYFKTKIKSTLSRISDVFPDVESRGVKSALKEISGRFDAISRNFNDALFYNVEKNLSSIILSVMPADDSSLMWGDVKESLSTDADEKLSFLFERYISRYEKIKPVHRKTDEDIWKNINKGLEKRHIDHYFSEKYIENRNIEIKFQSAWKNGIWHCLEPISFDLAQADSIKEKANRILGAVTSVRNAPETFKVYLILSKPKTAELLNAFENAKNILETIPVDNEVVLEEDSDELLDRFEAQIKSHHYSN